MIPSCANPLKDVKAKLRKPIAMAIAVNNKALLILLLVESKNSLNFLPENSYVLKR